MEENKISYLYEGVLGVMDRSTEATGKIFHVHLFSNEKRTQFYDNEIVENLIKKASSDFTQTLENQVKNEIESKLHNLVKKSTFTNSISMLVEPIKTDILIFRLTNTIFE